MLGFLKPRGELVELKGRQVVFLADKSFHREQRLKVRLSLPHPNTQKLDLEVTVLSQRAGPKKRFVTVAVVETPRDYPTMTGLPIRLDRREPHRLTLKSGDLPGFRAVTNDLSIGGFGTELEGELVVGDEIVVTFEFDALQGFCIDLLAEVRWVHPRGGSRYTTGFSFPSQREFTQNYEWLKNWFQTREDTEVKKLFKQVSKHSLPPPAPMAAVPVEAPVEQISLEQVDKELQIRIPFKGFMRGWAWEQGDDMVVVVLEDDQGADHWLEFPGCRGMHGRCRDRKIRLQGVGLVFDSPLIKEYSRSVTLDSLFHFQFLDDYARCCLDIVATGCQEQRR